MCLDAFPGGASSSSSICRSAECLAADVEPSESNATVVAAGSGHASLSTSLPNLTTPTDEFMGDYYYYCLCLMA